MNFYRLYKRKFLFFSLYIVGLISLTALFPFVSGSMKQAFQNSSANKAIQTLTVTAPPTLSNYAHSTVALSGNITIAPDAQPINASSATATTTPDFKGKLEVDPTTGIVRITNAHPANNVGESYLVTVTAYNADGTATKTFNLTVTTPTGCSAFGASSFAPVVDLTVEDAPYGLAIGDFNADGKQDFVTANQFTDNISVLYRNKENDGFESAINFPAGINPYAVAVGDFNADGKQDIATTNVISRRVSVLLRNATNDGFARFSYAANNSPISIAVGDFNSDGRQDIVVVDGTGDQVSVLYRNAANTGFDPPVNFPVGIGPVSVTTGDLNGDGKQDIVTANNGSNNVSLLLRNTTNNGFETAINIDANEGPNSAAVGDFNGDGKQDIVVANSTNNSVNNNVTVLLRNATNDGFAQAVRFTVGGNPRSVAVGDFNTDGRQDIVAVNAESNNVFVLLRNAENNSFEPMVNFPVGYYSVSVAVGTLMEMGDRILLRLTKVAIASLF
ncbi:MAG: VCBS repeat-containing protein [Acidobacteriota bacterium]|nr:VCBS repeat-containing protein [Acidobacteriota bacterium]